ncbi:MULTISPECIES: DUF7133 domain-containing protein [unclassified Marinimicrobium]|jgi:cytochrome c553|uniref:DUF7133 domain-containing protein n=1 Tax=unclassified Marinimicrobium TaxID=2632100 RepID=UPI000C6C2961|nr:MULTISPECIES: family 16 glycoside hydrolase [unclassified Marinimicrobium]MAN50363.1 hypothetical protein [Marinimicrobium sp.]
MLKIIKRFGQSFWVVSAGVLSLFVIGVQASVLTPEAPWEQVHDVLYQDGRLEPVVGEGKPETLFLDSGAEDIRLLSEESLGDSVLTFEVLLAEQARAGVYLQGRYEVVLTGSEQTEALKTDSMGALAPRWNENRTPPEFDGVPPLRSVGDTVGQWLPVEIQFRAPRYNEAGQKVEPAMLLEVRINNQIVQKRTLLTGFTRGSINPWETTSGPLMVHVHQGPVALRQVSLAHADFSAVELPSETGGESNLGQLEDFVAKGEKAFKALGCTSCHAVTDGEKSVRAGPNLYGLFQRTPRDREVKQGEGDTRFTLKADRSYLHRSIRQPDAELAIAESGSNSGQVYQPIMPAYSTDTLSDGDLGAIGAYLKTLNPLATQGPVVQLVEEGGPEVYDPLTDGLQRLVLDEVQIQRGPMPGTSGRAIHVGLPNGVNYSFDPRVLGVVKLWQGGFLDMGGELRNRGGGGLRMGYDSREIGLGATNTLFAPLQPDGTPVDFSFKESVFQDHERVRAALYSEKDHFDLLAEVDARFHGYRRDSRQAEAAPTFEVSVGDNRFGMTMDISAQGVLTLEVDGTLNSEQRLQLATELVTDISVSEGSITEGQWVIPEGSELPVRLQGQLALSDNPWRPTSKSFDHVRQPLKVVPSQADLLDGYAIEDYLPPKDNYGRDLLFEPLGIAVADNGTVVVSTRNAGIWRLIDDEWHLFAEGLFDSLGVVIEDKAGLDLVVGQKAELTRIRDTNGDGRADHYQTLFDGFGYHSNYHTYLHGPVKGADGAYYLGLNLAHTDEAVYKADGLYMGSQGGFSGWAFRVTPDGEATPWASGLRSAAGWALGPDDQVWFTENQGEFVGTSKLFMLKKNAFYGHPSGLVDLPGMTPGSQGIAWSRVRDHREPERLLMPQNLLANSPGHPVWDTTQGRFGPFSEQILIGDQTQSNLFRVALETLPDGTVQGAAMPFARDLASGAMRPVFLPDGSLLLGQTGRGWQAKGGHVAALQRVSWQGEQPPLALKQITVTEDGFTLQFTRALPETLTPQALADALALSSWTYRDAPDYGSEQLGQRDEAIAGLTLSDDRTAVTLELESTEVPNVHPQQTARVYHFTLESDVLTRDHGGVPMSAFYTLHRFAP